MRREVIVAGTGHRPNKLGGYDDRVFKRLVDLAKAIIKETKATKVISGMALGWDQALAQAAIELGIPFIAAIPFKGQESRWPTSSQKKYQEIIQKAEEIIIVCPGEYSPKSMQIRNEWMVDNCDLVIALWDGSSGGTGKCIRYEKSINKPINNQWARCKKQSGI